MNFIHQVSIFILVSVITALFSQNPEWHTFTPQNSNIPGKYVRCIAFDDSGGTWVGTENGVGRLIDTVWTIYRLENSGLPDNDIHDIEIDSHGNIWIATTYGGLGCFHGDSAWTNYNTSNSGLPETYVTSLAIDSSENLWIGTMFGGLAEYDGSSWTMHTKDSTGLVSQDIEDIEVDHNGNIWIATLQDGLAKYDGINWTTFSAQHLPYQRIWDLEIDPHNYLWIGTAEGYYGPRGGLTRFDGAAWTTWEISNSEIPSNHIWAITNNADISIWIGTSGGISKFDGDSAWTVYNPQNSDLPDTMATAIRADALGNIWIGTYENGLAVFNEKGIKNGIRILYPGKNSGVNVVCYPNPFSTSTNLQVLLRSAECGVPNVSIYDINGRQIARFDQFRIPHSEFGIRLTWDASRHPAGAYFIKARTRNNSFLFSDKIIKLR
jgi:ligand-binding sensor domain-containing protein